MSATLTETLPSEANDQAVVQVRWIYWESNGTTGSRDRIAVDDISITGTAIPSDTTAPDTTITSAPSNPSSSADASFEFTGTDNVGVTGFECSLDGGAFASCTSPANYTGLADGQHTFEVRAKDAAGNVDATPASYTWTIATAPAADIDLTISRGTSDTSVSAGDTVSFTVTVSNGGADAANNVRAVFTVPSGLTFVSATTGGTFTASEAGGVVTFDGGTLAGGASQDLIVNTTANTAGTKPVAIGAQTAVDPNDTIDETDESNNTAAGDLEIRVRFASPTVGLQGRASLAQLLADVNDIGIDSDGNFESIVRLDQNLTDQNADIVVPDGVTLDFDVYTVSGTANFVFGGSTMPVRGLVGGAGFKTKHANGLGDAAHPGSIQTTGTVTFNGFTDATFNGTAAQTAYGMPTEVGTFEIDNAAGLTVVAPFNVHDDFFLTNGIISNGANTITLGALSRNNGDIFGEGSAASFVSGAIAKIIPPFFGESNDLGGALSYVFPVGTVGGTNPGYTPLKATFNSANPGDSLTVRAFDTNSPGVPTASLSRYWEITENGDVNVDLEFRWLDGDEAELNETMDLRVFRNTYSVCSLNSICSVSLATNTATISNVSNFSPWTIAEFVATAASVEVGGRVTDARGNAIANARVFVTDQNGAVRTARTNNFGNYRIGGLEAGTTYVFTAESRENTFAPQIIAPQENVADFNFAALD